ncbi:MAG: MiaB/RimO family radical SAM methylthiotransferase, partial [Candidatus Krumholzibacteria bacterium]|nr:MiaB/RimO family radical SAM methylthiotransferase [Candidatus Krumholzibacteria bacterium]
MNVHLVTLGCPKNLVDSEASLTLLRRSGFSVTDDPAAADVLVVSACSFMEASWRETVEEVERLGAYKDRGKRLVLMGCLPRHRGLDLPRALPMVDHFLPSGAHARLPELLAATKQRAGRVVSGRGADRFAALVGRDLLTAPHTAYVKVAEGCNRACTFCAIPAIRGRQMARPARDIVVEVEGLVARGVREVTLLAQDIVSWRDGRARIADLAADLSRTGVEWIRVFYVHPAGLDVAHVRRLLETPGVVHYLEIPVQHASSRLLTRMKRGYDRRHLESVLASVRAALPDVVLRSEVIVGFPGEGEAEFEELQAFVEEFRFDSLGIFTYSPEPGTAAARMDGAVDGGLVAQRADALAATQEAVSFGAR